MIEDDEYISRVYERAFRLSGHTIMLSPDGELALKDLSEMKELPDAILLDIVMPNMRGEELLQKLKTDDTYKHIPIAVLTNSIHASKGPEYLSMGADLYLIKIDYTPKEVIEKLQALIHT